MRLSFSIISMLLVLAVLIPATLHYQILWIVSRHLSLIAALACLASFLVAVSVGDKRPAYLLIPAGLAIVVVAYAIFTHSRLYAFLEESFPRRFPYPDFLIASMINSIPSPDDQPNRTWERIVITVNLGAIVLAVAAGTLVGMVCRPSRRPER